MSFRLALGSVAPSTAIARVRAAVALESAPRASSRAARSAAASPPRARGAHGRVPGRARRVTCPIRLGGLPLPGVRAVGGAGDPGGIEEHRRGTELVEHEHENAEQQDEELHRHLDQPVEQEPELALSRRVRGQDASDLRLVGAEVGELEEEPADQAGPQVVAARRIEAQVDGVELAGSARHARARRRDRARPAAQRTTTANATTMVRDDDAELERVACGSPRASRRA